MPSSRQPYTECSIYYDGSRGLEVGHYLATPAGAAYLVTSIRQNSKQLRRKHLKCLRWPKAEIPADAVVHPLYWYSRDKKPTRRLSAVKS